MPSCGSDDDIRGDDMDYSQADGGDGKHDPEDDITETKRRCRRKELQRKSYRRKSQGKRRKYGYKRPLLTTTQGQQCSRKAQPCTKRCWLSPKAKLAQLKREAKGPGFLVNEMAKRKRQELEQKCRPKVSKQESNRHRTEERKKQFPNNDGETQIGDYQKSSENCVQQNDPVHASSRDQQKQHSVCSKPEQTSPEETEVSREEGSNFSGSTESGNYHTEGREGVNLEGSKPTAMVKKKKKKRKVSSAPCNMPHPPRPREKKKAGRYQTASPVQTSPVNSSSIHTKHLYHPRKDPQPGLHSDTWSTVDNTPQHRRHEVGKDKKWVEMKDSEPEGRDSIFTMSIDKSSNTPSQLPQTFPASSIYKPHNSAKSPNGTSVGSSGTQQSSAGESSASGRTKSGGGASDGCEELSGRGKGERDGRNPSERREPVNSKDKSTVKVKKKAKDEKRTRMKQEEKTIEHQKAEEGKELSRGYGSTQSDQETSTCGTQLKTFPSLSGGENSSSLVSEENEYEPQPVQETCGRWHATTLPDTKDSLLGTEATLTGQEEGRELAHRLPTVTVSTKPRAVLLNITDSAIDDGTCCTSSQPQTVKTSTDDDYHHEVAVEQSAQHKDATSGLLVGSSFYSHGDPVTCAHNPFEDQTRPFPGLFEVEPQDLCIMMPFADKAEVESTITNAFGVAMQA